MSAGDNNLPKNVKKAVKKAYTKLMTLYHTRRTKVTVVHDSNANQLLVIKALAIAHMGLHERRITKRESSLLLILNSPSIVSFK